MKTKLLVTCSLVALLLALASCVPIPPLTATPVADPAGAPSATSRGGAQPTETPEPDCPLDITKDASAFEVEVQRWTLAKTSQPVTLTLDAGGSSQVDYTVTMDADDPPVENALVVTGTITITNSSALPAQIVDIVDVLSPAPVITGTVACEQELPFDLAAGETLLCGYAAELPDTSERLNTVTVTVGEPAEARGANPEPETPICTATAEVRFAGEQTVAIDQCVEVGDSFAGALGTACVAEGLPQEFTYSRTVGPLAICGSQTITNTATFTATDTLSTGVVTHTLSVNTPCLGCVSGQGYWKNHGDKASKQYDKAWDMAGGQGSGAAFYKSGKTWMQALETPAKDGNAYYILAYQYIAAKLNLWKGAGVTKEVADAVSAAEAYFMESEPLPEPADPQRSNLLSIAGLLEPYNTGTVGPEECK